MGQRCTGKNLRLYIDLCLSDLRLGFLFRFFYWGLLIKRSQEGSVLIAVFPMNIIDPLAFWITTLPFFFDQGAMPLNACKEAP